MAMASAAVDRFPLSASIGSASRCRLRLDRRIALEKSPAAGSALSQRLAREPHVTCQTRWVSPRRVPGDSSPRVRAKLGTV